MHGGKAPNAELAGVLAVARSEAQVMGTPLPIEPHEAILQLVWLAAGEVRYCSERIAELEASEAVGPVKIVTRRPARTRGYGEDVERTATEVRYEAPELNIWIRARQDAADRLATYSKIAMAAGIAERHVRIQEAQATAMGAALDRVLTNPAVGLDDAQRRQVMQLLGHELAALRAPAAVAGLPQGEPNTLAPGGAAWATP